MAVFRVFILFLAFYLYIISWIYSTSVSNFFISRQNLNNVVFFSDCTSQIEKQKQHKPCSVQAIFKKMRIPSARNIEIVHILLTNKAIVVLFFAIKLLKKAKNKKKIKQRIVFIYNSIYRYILFKGIQLMKHLLQIKVNCSNFSNCK